MTGIAIIGAGIAGLACARTLAAAGLRPILFDKGRGIGGRVATRRVEGMQFDHGAQYVTARGKGFATILDKLAAAGAAADWQDGSGHRHRVGTPGMSSLAKALGTGLDVRQGVEVTGLVPASDGWLLRTATGEHQAAHLIVTVPAPQAAALLGPDHQLSAHLSSVAMDPCLTVMAMVTGPAPFITRRDDDDPLAWIAQDSSKPGRPQGGATAWVAQAGTAFSRMHLDSDPEAIAALMVPMLCDRLGASRDLVTWAAAHRWRYARASQPLGQPFLRNDDATLYLGGDWCLGPNVEDAWTSGAAIAEDLLLRLR